VDKDYSEETAEKIDREVSKIVREGYEKAKNLLSDNIDVLNKLAQELLIKEVLNADEINAIMGIDKEEVAVSVN